MKLLKVVLGVFVGYSSVMDTFTVCLDLSLDMLGVKS